MIYQIVVPRAAEGVSREDVQKCQEYVQRKLARKFGGFTMYPAQGGWINPSGELVHEPVNVFVAAEAGMVKGRLAWLAKLASEVKDAMKQTTVMYAHAPFFPWFTPQEQPQSDATPAREAAE